MELIKVNSVKLKIILTPSDMTELGITENQLDYSSASSKKAFWDILDRAKSLVSFDTKGDRLYVQFYPSKDGGGEMYVTRKAHILPQDRQEKSTYRRKYFAKRKGEGYIVSFEDTENIIALCARLKNTGFDGSSTLYFHDGVYYLKLTEKSMPTFTQNEKCADNPEEKFFICEYGDTFFADKVRCAFLEEHAKKLCSDKTVETFCEIFE